MISILLKQDINLNSAEDISKYINSMIIEINKIDDEILKDLTINKLCDETKVSKELILSKLTKKDEKQIVIPKPVIKKQNKYGKSVQSLLYYMLRDSEVIKIYDRKITHIPDDNYRHLAFQISAFYKQNGYINVADLLTEVHDDEETVKTIGQISSLNLRENYDMEEIEDYLNNIIEYNDLKQIDKYRSDLAMSHDLNEKLELANKLIAYKLRSEEND